MYLQYLVKLVAAEVTLQQEPIAAPLPHNTSHPPLCDQVWLLKRKVRSLENNKDTINELNLKNKDSIKILNTKKQLLKVVSKEENFFMNRQTVAMN